MHIPGALLFLSGPYPEHLLGAVAILLVVLAVVVLVVRMTRRPPDSSNVED